MKRSPLHLESFLQAIILFGFALYFVGTVVSGSAYRYVHERHISMLLITAVLFAVVGILKARQAMDFSLPLISPRIQYKEFGKLSVFIIALIGMLIAAGTDFQFSQLVYADSLSEQYNTVPSMPMTAESQTPQPQNGAIVMNDNTFSPWLAELYTKLDKWAGTKITVTGSVWKDKEIFEQNEFAVARMMMMCCAADMQPIGLLAQWENMETLTDGEWVELTGTIAKKPYQDGFDPLILVETVKKIERPQREYIYP